MYSKKIFENFPTKISNAEEALRLLSAVSFFSICSKVNIWLKNVGIIAFLSQKLNYLQIESNFFRIFHEQTRSYIGCGVFLK